MDNKQRKITSIFLVSCEQDSTRSMDHRDNNESIDHKDNTEAHQPTMQRLEENIYCTLSNSTKTSRQPDLAQITLSPISNQQSVMFKSLRRKQIIIALNEYAYFRQFG